MTDETSGAAAPDTQAAEIAAAIEQPVATPHPLESARAEEAEAQKAEAEAKAKAETETTEPEPEEGEETEADKPKRLTRNQRLQRTNSRLANENAELAIRLKEIEARLPPTPQPTAAKDAEPQEAEFNGDYFKYTAAKAAYDARQAVRAEFAEQRQIDAAKELQRERGRAVSALDELAKETRTRIPDFDKVLEDFQRQGGTVAPHVQQAVFRLGEEGPSLLYTLAKNPGLAQDLNSMDPFDAAMEIAELRAEGKLSLAEPKKQTKAPPPVKPPTGGASPTPNIHELAQKGDMDSYIKLRESIDKARGKPLARFAKM